MRTRFVEVTQSLAHPFNHGKFAVCLFTEEEWARQSEMDRSSGYAPTRLLQRCGWEADKFALVLDLQTGEGAMFRLGGSPVADLNKHAVWVCPMFEPFLAWLYDHARARPPRHTLSEIDAEARSAVCAVCGPTSVRRRGNGQWRCKRSPGARKRAAPLWFESLPSLVELPHAEPNMYGYRRPGPAT